MSLSEGSLISSGGSPQSLRWFDGEFENAIGSAGSDIIYGNNLANTINAEDGDDFISGGLGSDMIDGGQ